MWSLKKWQAFFICFILVLFTCFKINAPTEQTFRGFYFNKNNFVFYSFYIHLLNKWTVLSILFSFLPGIVCLEENPSPQKQRKNTLYCTDIKLQCLLWICILFCFWASVWILWVVFSCVWFMHSADRGGFGFAWTISTWTSLCTFLA